MAKKAKTKLALTGVTEMKQTVDKIEDAGSLTKEERTKLHRYKTELGSLQLQIQAHCLRLDFIIGNFVLRERKSRKPKEEGEQLGKDSQDDSSSIDPNAESGKEGQSEGFDPDDIRTVVGHF